MDRWFIALDAPERARLFFGAPGRAHSLGGESPLHETPHQYRLRAQIDKAKHLLILTDLSVTEVCMEIGFSSLGSFSTLFSHRAGMSPSEFQRRYRSATAPEQRLPASLIPGCLSLMAGISGEEHFSRRQPMDDADSV